MLLAALAGMIAAQPVRAADRNWTNPAGGNFTDPGNWQNGNVPATTDTAVFKLGATYKVNMNSNQSIGALVNQSDDVTLDLGGTSLSVGGSNPAINDLLIAPAGSPPGLATLTLLNGTLNSLGDPATRTIIGLGKNNSSGELNISSGATFNETGGIIIGVESDGLLTVSNGASMQCDYMQLGSFLNGSGTAIVRGAGTKLTVGSHGIVVGDGSPGSFTVEQGATIQSGFLWVGNVQDSSHAVIDGTGTNWTLSDGMSVGVRGGSGAMTISNGATLTTAFLSGIGVGDGSNGTVVVDGVGSKWGIGGLAVATGKSATAQLSISNGGRVEGDFGTVGGAAGSTASVNIDGVGSTWSNTGEVIVGVNAQASITVSNGGKLLSGTPSPDPSGTRIGTADGSNGTVTVTGTGSSWTNASGLRIGFLPSSNGLLQIQAGGTVSNTDAALASFPGALGSALVTGQGSTWTNTGQMNVGGDTLFGAGGTGIVTIADQASVSVTGNAKVWPLGTIHLDGGSMQAALFNLAGGTLSGAGDVTGNVSNGGQVSPGNSPGTLTVHGDFSQLAAGTLKMELASSGFDILHVTGAAHLAGTLKVTLLDGFMPLSGTSYDLLSASSLDGTFDNVQLPTLPNGHTWQLAYGATDLTVTAVPEPSSVVLALLGTLALGAAAYRKGRGRRSHFSVRLTG